VAQYGFYFDQSRCSGCRACAVACKNWNALPPEPLKFLRIYEYEKGDFPDVRVHIQWIPCYHCEEPACIAHCPSEAIYKENSYGAVLIDSEKCDGCRICYEFCPYGALVFENDKVNSRIYKCNMCIQRLEQGLQPICVSACPTRALDFGPLNSLVERYGNIRDIEDMPSSHTTRPAVIYKFHTEKRDLVPYNRARAVELFMSKDNLSKSSLSKDRNSKKPQVVAGRSKLVIKHESIDKLMQHTRCDEG
jgi:anaerobic dimethyl sulfoxide reductase subunit B (iron-sulfur subunit)